MIPSLRPTNYFPNPTARARQSVTFFINPFGKRQVDYFMPHLREMIALATFRILRAAMLAEPAVAEIEEVRRLVHRGAQISDLKSQIPDRKTQTETHKTGF